MKSSEVGPGADSVVAGDPYPAAPDGILSSDGLRKACAHVWRDSNSTVMLGADPLNSEPVSCDDRYALAALKRHIVAAGRRSFVDDVLPNLGFGRTVQQVEASAVVDSDTVNCDKCGVQAVPLHLGCRLCEDCCDCRPLGT